MKVDKRSGNVQTGWDLVEEHIEEARLIAWDTCHKIYLALDDVEADWFRNNYDCVVEGSPEEMMTTLRKWWDESCWLRFINGVRYTTPNANDGFIPLIEQGATDDDDEVCPDCDETWCDGSCTTYEDDEEESE